MHFVSGIVVFVLIWWIVIFCVLPFGVSTTQEKPDQEDEYIAPGAPKNINIKSKFIITTAITFVLWVVVYVIIESNIIDLRHLANTME